jgi:arylsulfatase
MPTFAQLAGIKCPSTDGISIMPTLLGKNKRQKQHEYLYWEFNEIKGAKAVRWGKWKGLLDNIKKGNTTMQLFDLEKDVREQHDVADEHPDVVKKIQQIMKEARTVPANKKFNL